MTNDGRQPNERQANERRIVGLIFLLLLLCYAYFFPRWADWNQNTRMDLTMAIVDQGTIRIDDYYLNTGDYAVYGGHVYTDKAPGSSFLGIAPYFVFRTLANSPAVLPLLMRLGGSETLAETLRAGGSGLLTDKVYFAAALYFTTFFVVSAPSAFLGALLFLLMGGVLSSVPARIGLALGYGLATIVFPYSTVLYGHQIVAVLGFCAFYLLLRVRRAELSNNWLYTAGVLMGMSVLTEYPTAILVLILGMYALWFVQPRWQIVKLIAGGLPFAVLLGLYNQSAFGSPFTTSYRYLGLFAEYAEAGIVGFGRPDPFVLWSITFGPYRGLFFLSPFLLLAIPGFWYLLRTHAWRAEAIVSLVWIAAQLVLVSSWWAWHGGFSIGPRNLIVILPFFMLPVAMCVERWQERPLLLKTAWSLVVLSAVFVWIASVSGQQFAEDTVANPLFEYSLPHFLAGDISRNLGMVVGLASWGSLLPLFVIVGGLLWGTRRVGV